MAKTPSSTSPSESSNVLVSALVRLLKPLIKLLIARGITLPYLTRLLKSLYVQVAETDFRLAEKRLSDSRISLITGIHRKEVQKLRAEEIEKPEVPANISIGTRLISIWVDSRAYTDKKGAPRKLPLRTEDARQPSFEKLVNLASRRDLSPRVVLDELVRMGIATVDDDQRVELNVEAFVPDNSFDEKAWYFGENVSAHVAAGVHNLLDEQPPFMERSVSYSGLSEQDVDRLEKKINKLGMKALKDINHDAQRLKKKTEEQGGDGKLRFTFGVYFYKKEESNEPSV